MLRPYKYAVIQGSRGGGPFFGAFAKLEQRVLMDGFGMLL
jgi:hypothetical protein